MALIVVLSALRASTMPATAADHELKLIPSSTHTGSFDARIKPVLRIAPGDTVKVETLVAFGMDRLLAAGASIRHCVTRESSSRIRNADCQRGSWRVLEQRCESGGQKWLRYCRAGTNPQMPDTPLAHVCNLACDASQSRACSRRRRLLLSAGWLSPSASAARPRCPYSAMTAKYSISRSSMPITEIHVARKPG
jgi:hypothetical protein